MLLGSTRKRLDRDHGEINKNHGGFSSRGHTVSCWATNIIEWCSAVEDVGGVTVGGVHYSHASEAARHLAPALPAAKPDFAPGHLTRDRGLAGVAVLVSTCAQWRFCGKLPGHL